MSSNRSRCEEAKELLAAYSIGATDPEESELVEAALAECPELAGEMGEYLALSQAMLHLVPQKETPPAFDDMPPLPSTQQAHTHAGNHHQPPKITQLHTSTPVVPLHTSKAEAQPQKRKQRTTGGNTRMWWGAVAAALVLILLTNVYWLSQVNTLRDSQRILEQRLAEQEQRQAIVPVTSNEQHHRELLATQDNNTEAHATVLWNAGKETGSLHVTGLPALDRDLIYQLWLVRDGEAISMGLFEVDETGTGILLFEAPEPIENYDAIGVSIEPAPGSKDPTTPHVVIGEI